jgi:hypothetical protein
MSPEKYLLLFVFIFLISISNVFPQYADCTPDYSITDPNGDGIRHPVDLPIAFRGEPYSTVMTIIPPEKARTWGFDFTITKIQLTHMENMPIGLSWETNSGNSDDYMSAPDSYCLILEGTPTSQAGSFKVGVYANAWVRVVFEIAAPGNPQYGGDVKFTLCNSLNLNLGADRVITENQQITLSANQNTSYHTYLWSDNSTDPTLTINGTDFGIGEHEITVSVFDTVGTTGVHQGSETKCFKTASVKVTVLEEQSVDELFLANFEVFPNPTAGNIIVKCKPEQLGSLIIIRDNKGKIVFEDIILKEDSNFDLSGLSSGLYYAEFIKDNFRGLQRISIIR